MVWKSTNGVEVCHVVESDTTNVTQSTRKRNRGWRSENTSRLRRKERQSREGIESIYLSCSSFSAWSLSSNWALRLLLAAVCLLISLLAFCGEKESHIYPIIWYPIVQDSFMNSEPSGCLMRTLFHICLTEIYRYVLRMAYGQWCDVNFLFKSMR